MKDIEQHFHIKFLYMNRFKVSVKENEVPPEKNSSRTSIFATKASYISKIKAKIKLPYKRFYFIEFQ